MINETKTPPVAVVILAAGKGTRMRSALPKVLHEIAGQPMLHFAMRAALRLSPERLAVVVGHEAEAVASSARAVRPDVAICRQEEQLGTGHAVRTARPALEGFEGTLVVLYGDTPFVADATLAQLIAEPETLTALGFDAAEPGRYGRFLMEGDRLEAIVEAKDATPEQLAITTCNSGVMAGPAALMLRLLDRVSDDNAQGEFYLTDLIGLACAEGHRPRAVLCDEAETLGINDRVQLAEAEAAFQTRARREAMLAGATLQAPETVHFAWDTVLGRDVVVEPNVCFAPGVSVADGARIRAFSHLEGATVGPGAIVGPYARLRPGTVLGDDVRIGNFVETKNATLGQGAKANHLTYIGDASVGENANLGAGTITCNYDGFDKHFTRIGANAFIGVNSALVAPVEIGDDAYTATGSVITRNVPAGDLSIARARQENKAGIGRKLRERLAAAKAKRKAEKTGG